MECEGDVDVVIDKLVQFGGGEGEQAGLTQSEIMYIATTSVQYLLEDPSLLELQSPINIISSIFGNFSTLLKVFEYGGFPPDVKYLFLGNIVDREKMSIECITLLLAYKIKYPN